MLSHIRLFSLLFLSAHLCLITPSRAETPPGRTSFAGQERRWEMLYGREFYVLLKKRPLAWLPLGILEKHGDHLPWGLDGLKAHAVCLRMADEFGGIVLPAQQLAGVHGDRQNADEQAFRLAHREVGDFMFREQTFRLWLRETLDALENIGFRVIVAYTGHYPEAQTRIVQQVAEEFNSSGKVTVIPFWEPLACGEGDHGGKWESSLFLALQSGGVRLFDVREDDSGREGSYRGVPVREQVSREFGEAALEMIQNYLGSRIDSVFKDCGPEK